MLTSLKNFVFNNILFLIFFLYLLFILSIFFSSNYITAANFIDGYILGGDSIRYIDGANKIINSEYPTGKATSYIGYIIFLSLFQYLDLNLTFVVISQVLLTILSAICLYRITKYFSSHIGGIFSLTIYLFYFPLQIRNFYILTDTLFICSIIFITYLLVFFKKKYLPILVFLILFTAILRPHGVILIPSILLSTFIWFFINEQKKYFFLLFFLLVILCYPILSLLNLYLENEKIINKIIDMGIIYGYKSENNFLKYKINGNLNNDFLSLLIFFKNNITIFITAFTKKIFFFFLRVRPFYSDIHNLYLILFNFIIYLPAIYGVLKLNLRLNIGINFIYSLILFFVLAIGLSFVDWSGRFSLYIFPLFFILSGIGIHNLIKKY